MRIVVAFWLMMALAACGQIQDINREIAKDAAQGADEVLAIGEWTVCWAASVGSVRRRYGPTVEGQEAYNDFCAQSTPSTGLFSEPEQ